jgi:hypothetical protein
LLPPDGLPRAPIEALPFAVEDLDDDLAVVVGLIGFEVDNLEVVIPATDDEADLPVEPLALEVPNPTADTPDDDPLLDLAPPTP